MRIASLLPSATEIVCSLGMEHELVAVTHECDYPESVRAKPVLTTSMLSESRSGVEVDRHIRELVHQGSSIYALDTGLLEALHPDLILTQELCEVCAVSYPIVERAARRLGSSPQLVSLEPESLEDVFQNILFVGRLVGRDDTAQEVCDSLRRRVTTVEQRVAGRRARKVVCLECVDPPYNCGHRSSSRWRAATSCWAWRVSRRIQSIGSRWSTPIPRSWWSWPAAFPSTAACARSRPHAAASVRSGPTPGWSMATPSSAALVLAWSTAWRSWQASFTLARWIRRRPRRPGDCREAAPRGASRRTRSGRRRPRSGSAGRPRRAGGGARRA